MVAPRRINSIDELAGMELPAGSAAIAEAARPEASAVVAEQNPVQRAKDKAKAESKAAQQKALDGRSSRIMLATLKAYSPLISAAVYRYGNEAPGENAAEAVKEMMGAVDRISLRVEQVLNVNRANGEQAWIVGKLASMISVHVGKQWRTSAEDDPSIDEDGIATAVSRLLEGPLPKIDDDRYEKVEDNAGLYLSLTGAMASVLVESGILRDFVHDAHLEARIEFVEDEVIDRAATDIFDVAAAMVNLMNPEGHDTDRLIMMQSCLRQCGYIYASSLAHITDDVIEVLIKAEDAGKLPQVLADVPKGTLVNMDDVRTSFEASAMRLAVIASRFGEMPSAKKVSPAR